NPYEVRKCNKRTVKQSNRPAVSGEREDRPRQTPWCRKSWANSLQVVDGALHNRFLRSITHRQQRDRRIVSVRCKGGPIDDSVPGIPSSARAGAVEKHLDR